ncbi:unnamed protein product, partial [Symbiodinium pilosum]
DTVEFNMLLGLRRTHPPDVIGKYAPGSLIGVVGGVAGMPRLTCSESSMLKH